MPSVVAIHGTGVREAAYQQMLDVMTRRFQKQRPAYQITPCPWYKKHGVAAPPYKSAPLRKEFRAVGQSDESDEVLAWQGLIVDPLSELRNMTEDGEGFASPTAGAQLAANVRQVTRPEGLQAYEMVPFWEPARDLVLSDDATKDAIARGASPAGRNPPADRACAGRGCLPKRNRTGQSGSRWRSPRCLG